MKKIIIQILTILISINSIAQIDGEYRHNICEYGPNCFVYIFNKNGTFEYKYHQDILGSGRLSGKYEKKNDTLKLYPNQTLFESKSRVIENDFQESKYTKIEIYLQRLAPQGKEDIQKTQWYISINNGEYIETNDNGGVFIPRTKVERIELKDIFQIELKYEDPILKLTEYVFYPKTDKNLIQIFASESEENVDLAITSWMTKAFIIKGRKLYPLTFEPEVGFLGQSKTYYQKIN